jgi:hypothetical protein
LRLLLRLLFLLGIFLIGYGKKYTNNTRVYCSILLVTTLGCFFKYNVTNKVSAL